MKQVSRWLWYRITHDRNGYERDGRGYQALSNMATAICTMFLTAVVIMLIVVCTGLQHQAIILGQQLALIQDGNALVQGLNTPGLEIDHNTIIGVREDGSSRAKAGVIRGSYNGEKWSIQLYAGDIATFVTRNGSKLFIEIQTNSQESGAYAVSFQLVPVN